MEEKKGFCTSGLAIRTLLYSDTLCGKQVGRDDMWAVTTEELKRADVCIQALSGIHDPLKWVSAVEEIVRHIPLHEGGPDTENGDGYAICDCDFSEYLQTIRAARTNEGKKE